MRDADSSQVDQGHGGAGSKEGGHTSRSCISLPLSCAREPATPARILATDSSSRRAGMGSPSPVSVTFFKTGGTAHSEGDSTAIWGSSSEGLDEDMMFRSATATDSPLGICETTQSSGQQMHSSSRDRRE